MEPKRESNDDAALPVRRDGTSGGRWGHDQQGSRSGAPLVPWLHHGPFDGSCPRERGRPAPQAARSIRFAVSSLRWRLVLIQKNPTTAMAIVVTMNIISDLPCGAQTIRTRAVTCKRHAEQTPADRRLDRACVFLDRRAGKRMEVPESTPRSCARRFSLHLHL